MSTNLDAYRQQLLFALRLRNVPGPRIGEAIAEVESHLAETGEDPVVAFGEPAEYARLLAESLDRAKVVSGTGASGPWVRPIWTNAVVAALSFAGFGLATTGLLRRDWVMAVIGLVLLASLAIWLVRRRDIDRIVDPRTGVALRVPVPRWALVVLGGSLAVLTVLAIAVRWLAGA
jgi:hypothetical protein